jgi:hypothetical protein
MGPSYKTKIKQRRGFGNGSDYIPWIKVGEFSGQGNSVRSLGLKSGREHHFHSNKEAEIFYIFDLNPDIEEIQEQFPLLDFQLAQGIAQEAGISYPTTNNTDPHILTTDQFVTYKTGRKVAYTFKYLKDMAKSKRQLELFEIERRYWQKKAIEFFIITDEHIPEREIRLAYKDLHASCQNNDFELLQFQNVYTYLMQESNASNLKSVIDLTKEMDLVFDYQVGSSLRMIKIMIAKRLITTKLETPITSTKKLLSQLNFNFEHAAAISQSDLAA